MLGDHATLPKWNWSVMAPIETTQLAHKHLLDDMTGSPSRNERIVAYKCQLFYDHQQLLYFAMQNPMCCSKAAVAGD